MQLHLAAGRAGHVQRKRLWHDAIDQGPRWPSGDRAAVVGAATVRRRAVDTGASTLVGARTTVRARSADQAHQEHASHRHPPLHGPVLSTAEPTRVKAPLPTSDGASVPQRTLVEVLIPPGSGSTTARTVILLTQRVTNRHADRVPSHASSPEGALAGAPTADLDLSLGGCVPAGRPHRSLQGAGPVTEHRPMYLHGAVADGRRPASGP
jgi:hypothetical protein